MQALSFHSNTDDWRKGSGRGTWESSAWVWERDEEDARTVPGWTGPQDKASVGHG